jgi:hypothetical protein
MPKRCQEQIQMITMVIGRAAPKAPPIINANSEVRASLSFWVAIDLLVSRFPSNAFSPIVSGRVLATSPPP